MKPSVDSTAKPASLPKGEVNHLSKSPPAPVKAGINSVKNDG